MNWREQRYEDSRPYEDMLWASGLEYDHAHRGMIFELDGLHSRGLFYVSEMSNGRFSLRINRIATPYQAKRILSLAFHEGK